MFLFIFESIGTSEMILVGIVALIFLGPRKLPELTKKAGKMMAEFRGTANEFKETWQREVNFEEEAKALDIKTLESEPIARAESQTTSKPVDAPALPSIKEIDPASFDHLKPAETEASDEAAPAEPIITNDKKNWL